jgi:hypothetical protein
MVAGDVEQTLASSTRLCEIATAIFDDVIIFKIQIVWLSIHLRTLADQCGGHTSRDAARRASRRHRDRSSGQCWPNGPALYRAIPRLVGRGKPSNQAAIINHGVGTRQQLDEEQNQPGNAQAERHVRTRRSRRCECSLIRLGHPVCTFSLACRQSCTVHAQPLATGLAMHPHRAPCTSALPARSPTHPPTRPPRARSLTRSPTRWRAHFVLP